MPEIVLTTLNAGYAHAAFGLRYLMANLGPLESRAEILEFECAARTVDVIESILARRPRIVGVAVYIWCLEQATRLVADLKRLRPDVLVVLGGPEVSYEARGLEIVQHADHVISGEADLAFAQLCRQLLEPQSTGNSCPRPSKFIQAELPSLPRLQWPYALYTPADIDHRVIYVEASRGCPYDCEFCLSSLDVPVRQFPLQGFLDQMAQLVARGARQFKFVDRTFNLNIKTSAAILNFFADHYAPPMFLHFEMIPDRLPQALHGPILRFPPGALQFEVGIQTFNDEVASLISRRQDNALVEHNLRWLRERTGVHLHADLIAGLPGETLESFARGFDRLVSLGPHEIQVGMLKRLRGTPLARHDGPFGMIYSRHAPYEILQTSAIDFATMQRLRRFARYWDLVSNSGNFRQSAPLLWEPGSPFDGFLRFCEWLFDATGKTHGMALTRLAELVFRYLVQVRRLDPDAVAPALWQDYCRGGRNDRPPFLRPYLPESARPSVPPPPARLRRQARHAAQTPRDAAPGTFR